MELHGAANTEQQWPYFSVTHPSDTKKWPHLADGRPEVRQNLQDQHFSRNKGVKQREGPQNLRRTGFIRANANTHAESANVREARRRAEGKKKCMKNNADPGPLLVLQRVAKRLEEGPQGGSQDPSSAPAPTHNTCMHICRSTHTRTMWAYAERKIRKKNKKQNQIFFFFKKSSTPAAIPAIFFHHVLNTRSARSPGRRRLTAPASLRDEPQRRRGLFIANI